MGLMSVAWMSLIAVVVVAQKVLPPRAAVDAPLAVAIVGLGIQTPQVPAKRTEPSLRTRREQCPVTRLERAKSGSQTA